MASAYKEVEAVRAEAATCTRCPLYLIGTQTVFGAGPARAAVILVGEQPGNKEDLTGLPFVGPAGGVLDKALEQANVDRKKVYVTNAVKHFKHVLRGKRRIHQRPNTGEIDRCKWWLDRELEIIRPEVVVAMGAVAARSVRGKATGIEKCRGRLLPFRDKQRLLVTVHPSMVLRLPEKGDRDREFARFVVDLAVVADALPEVRLNRQMERETERRAKAPEK